MTKVLIIGSGGREHALGWKISQNENVKKVFYAPGNGGTEENKGINISINYIDIFEFIISEKIDMVIVGPEGPLVEGIVDYLNARGYNRVFGPTKNASLLESDKFFSYDIMDKLHIPQAESVKCHNLEETIQAINKLSDHNGIVLKARGLTGGKGVGVYNSKEEALKEIESQSKKYGPEILVAKRLFGLEFSIFGISDGNIVYPFEIAFQDHKRLKDEDRGPNTGGMGAYGPVAFISNEMVNYICKSILNPVVQEMRKLGTIYKGFIYAGMMMTKEPKVLEFNVRFGDPEGQPAMMMLKSDLYSLLSSALDGEKCKIEFNPGAACCIVLASKGYPYHFEKGLPIHGLDDAEKIENVKIFHAGTKKEGNNIVTNGGRILGITGYSPNGIEEARDLAYDAITRICIKGGFSYRRDIAI